jgi:hypothetical protein
MRKERTALTLIIVLPLIVLIGYFKTELLASQQADSLEERRFWILKTHRSDTFDVVLLGDSRVNQGLSPAAMQTVLKDLHILNFSYIKGGLTPEIYAVAEQRFSSTSAQPIVVLGITPLAFTPLAAQNAYYHKYLEKPPYERFLFLHLTPVLVFISPITPETLFEYLQFTPPNEKHVIIKEYYDDGWIASRYSKDDPNSALTTYKNVFKNNQVSKELVEELLAQTQQWTQEGILVFGFRFPSTQQILLIEDERSGFDEAALKEDFVNAGGIWIDIPADAYRSYDGSHLHKDGAVEFSIDLAEFIAEYLETPTE